MTDRDTLQARLRQIADEELARTGGTTFMEWPDRWWDTFLRRCTNDHVSRMTLKSEALGRDACLACGAHVHMTFPEDRDGPLTSRP